MALTPKETRIMDRWDAGYPVTAIARALAIPLDQVRKTITYYEAGAEDRNARNAMIAASQELAAAIHREKAA